MSIASKVKSQFPKLRKLAPKLLLARAIVCCRARRESPLHEWHLLALWHSSAESLFVPFPSAVPYRCRLSHLSLPSLTDSLSDILWPKSETHRVLRSRNPWLGYTSIGAWLSFPTNRARGALYVSRKQELLHFDTSDDYPYKTSLIHTKSNTR